MPPNHWMQPPNHWMQLTCQSVTSLAKMKKQGKRRFDAQLIQNIMRMEGAPLPEIMMAALETMGRYFSAAHSTVNKVAEFEI